MDLLSGRGQSEKVQLVLRIDAANTSTETPRRCEGDATSLRTTDLSLDDSDVSIVMSIC